VPVVWNVEVVVVFFVLLVIPELFGIEGFSLDVGERSVRL